MIERFPREQSLLERTRLRYVNLPAILSDGKRDRTSRVPGFVVVFLGDEVEIVWLLDGEPATAGRLSQQRREVLSVRAVVERAAATSEHADVAFYRAPEAQLCAMFATLAAPVLPADALDATHPGRLFTSLRDRGFNGVLEVREGSSAHYLLWCDGEPEHAFLADHAGAEPLAAALERLCQPARATWFTAAGYEPVPALPVQAPGALVDLYAGVVRGAIAALGEAIGAEEASRCMEGALARARSRHAALASYRVLAGGEVAGDPVESADALTDATAAWLFEALTAASRNGGVQPAELTERITREHRFALEAQGFFRRLPWPLGA